MGGEGNSPAICIFTPSIFAKPNFAMHLKPVAVFDTIEPEIFKKEFYEPGVPVVIKKLSHEWPAYSKWSWDYFKQLVGDKKVPIYNNVKSDAYTPVNRADDY